MTGPHRVRLGGAKANHNRRQYRHPGATLLLERSGLKRFEGLNEGSCIKIEDLQEKNLSYASLGSVERQTEL